MATVQDQNLFFAQKLFGVCVLFKDSIWWSVGLEISGPSWSTVGSD